MKEIYIFVIAGILASSIFANVITPEWSSVTIRETPNLKQINSVQGKRIGYMFTERERGFIEKVKATSVKDAIIIDNREAFAAGAAKVNISFYTIAEREFPQGSYRLTITVQGPKDARVELFFEGKTTDNHHFYNRKPFTLSGKRETLSLVSEVPSKLNELHLRFDLLSSGEFQIFEAAFAPVSAENKKSVPPRKPITRKPELLFYAPFDGNAVAAKAKGNGTPLDTQNLEFVPGVKGQALRSTRAAKTVLKYATDKNLLPDAGTISLWYKPEWIVPGHQGGNNDTWYDFVSMARPAKRRGSGAIWFWCWAGQVRGDNSDPDDKSITAAFHLESGKWYHIVFTWDISSGKKALFIDGEKTFSTNDGYSPLIVKEGNANWEPQIIKDFFVGSHGDAEQAEGLIDELKIYSAPLSSKEWHELLAEELPLQLKLKKRYFLAGKNAELPFLINN